ncbi:MAG: cation:proton antiporter [Promethearchaeota archaeon]
MNSFLSIGVALIAGFTAGKFMNKIKVPAVAGYVLIGFILGESILGIFSGPQFDFLSVEVLTPLALSFIAFSIGSELQWRSLKGLGGAIIIISICEALGAFLLVGTSSYLLLPYFIKDGNIFQYLSIALILAAVSSATAPAATLMVLHEMKAKGDLTKTLMAVVAIDDAIALILYGFSSTIAKSLLSMQQVSRASLSQLHQNWSNILRSMILIPIKEIILTILFGIMAGIVLSFLASKIRDNEELTIITIGILICTAGIVLALHLDELLCCMVLGIVLSNAAPLPSLKAFRMANNVAPPIYCMFFVLAGAHLRIELIQVIGLLGVCYILMRVLGKILGSYLGAWISKAPKVVRKYLGFGLLSQIGVAIGLAMIVRQDFQNFAIGSKMSAWVINILLFTTLFTEIIGPVCTKFAVIRAGEAGKARKPNIRYKS